MYDRSNYELITSSSNFDNFSFNSSTRCSISTRAPLRLLTSFPKEASSGSGIADDDEGGGGTLVGVDDVRDMTLSNNTRKASAFKSPPSRRSGSGKTVAV